MTGDAIAPPMWVAAPPEVHSTLLSAGATAASMTAAGLSWTTLGAEYIAALAELEGIIASIQATYSGPSAEQFVMAHQPMLLWLADVAAKAEFTAASHAEIVAAYEGAVVAMPTLGELFENHFVHGVLIGTNFLGVNTIPIGLNEMDYHRMWQLAADVMSGWDASSTLSVNTIPPTPMSPLTLLLGVGESGSTSASAAGAANIAQASAGGASLQAATVGATTLLGQKAGTNAAGDSANAAAQSNQAQNAANKTDSAANPQNSGMDMIQQFASMVPEAASSATQGPGSMLSSAPQTLASAPQELSSLLSNMAGNSGASGAQAMPVGFSGTGAIRGFNPAGLTSMAGGAFGSGPSKPMMPSTWGAQPVTESASTARAITPVATGMGGAGASGSGAGGGAMGAGAHGASGRGAKKVSTYTDNAVDGDDVDADSDEGAYVMSR
ncbi:PPE family protein [Mycobacterium sp.]|uniref:PPE family protein n=1 Tax=Mycobacterium sp. TaxID=1785 RepID=UPI0025D29D33|nr:PPE family protein [Mycobacterium sp.]